MESGYRCYNRRRTWTCHTKTPIDPRFICYITFSVLVIKHFFSVPKTGCYNICTSYGLTFACMSLTIFHWLEVLLWSVETGNLFFDNYHYLIFAQTFFPSYKIIIIIIQWKMNIKKWILKVTFFQQSKKFIH